LAQELGLRVSATGLDVPDVDALLAAVREAHASGETVVLNATGPFTQDTLGIIDSVVRIGAAYADVNDEAGVLSKATPKTATPWPGTRVWQSCRAWARVPARPTLSPATWRTG
jgi:short subunit dehydrogenase-like uncharacterized protein